MMFKGAPVLLLLPLMPSTPACCQENQFDVVSIKQNRSGDTTRRHQVVATPTSLTMKNINFVAVIAWGFDLPYYQVSAPDWSRSEYYDILAKTDQPNSERELRMKLQDLLSNRLNMIYHRESKTFSGYLLTSIGQRRKIRVSKHEGEPVFQGHGMGWEARGVSMQFLARMLSLSMATPIEDETSLDGSFDFTLDLSPYFPREPVAREQMGDAMASAAESAIEDQLGLKLERHKVAVEMLLIDRLDKPSGNF